MSVAFGSTVANATDISPSSGQWANNVYKLDQLDSTNHEAHFERWMHGYAHSGTFGFRICWDSTNSQNVIKVEGDDNNTEPYTVEVSATQPTTSSLVDNKVIQNGDTIWLYHPGHEMNNPLFVFTVNSSHLWSSSLPQYTWTWSKNNLIATCAITGQTNHDQHDRIRIKYWNGTGWPEDTTVSNTTTGPDIYLNGTTDGTSGTANYTVTVPQNGTYSFWLEQDVDGDQNGWDPSRVGSGVNNTGTGTGGYGISGTTGSYYIQSMTAPVPTITTDVANWNQNLHVVTIPVTVANFGTNDKAELWVGGSYNSHLTVDGNFTYYFPTGQTTASTVFEVKYNDGTGAVSLSPDKSNSYSYTPLAQNHNIIINTSSTTWTDDLNSGGTTVSTTVRFSNASGTNTDGWIYLMETGNNNPVVSLPVSAHPTSNYVSTMSYTSASASTVYYLTVEGSNTPVMSHTTGSAPSPPPAYVFTFGSWDTSVTNQVRATFTQSNPTGSETVTLNHPTDSSKNVTVNHLAQEVTFTMTGTADDGTYSIGAEQQNYTYYSAPPAPAAPPATSTIPSGGGTKRYPMILTQLFNKKRSFYSIGLTHKDGQLDIFL